MANGTLSMRQGLGGRVLRSGRAEQQVFDFDSSTPSSVAGPAWTACNVVDRDREDFFGTPGRP